ncbi:hypothetical protein ACLI4Q_10920 [Natrialbaceae archaeon A-CW1-1]
MIELKDWSDVSTENKKAEHMAVKIGDTLICCDTKWHDGRIFLGDGNEESDLITIALCPDGQMAEIKIGDVVVPII